MQKKERCRLDGFALGRQTVLKSSVWIEMKKQKGTMKQTQGSERWSDGGRNCKATSFPLCRDEAAAGGRGEGDGIPSRVL